MRNIIRVHYAAYLFGYSPFNFFYSIAQVIAVLITALRLTTRPHLHRGPENIVEADLVHTVSTNPITRANLILAPGTLLFVLSCGGVGLVYMATVYPRLSSQLNICNSKGIG